MSEIIYLIEVAAYTGSAEETFRFCTGAGYTTLPADSPGNTYYEPRVEHPGLFRQDMFSPGATSGGSSGGYGEIVLINTDGGLDGFIDYGFDGRRCVVKQGYAGAAYSTFATVITGTIEQAEVSWNRVTLRLKDRSVEIDTTMQTVFYTGANLLPAGIEGTAELKDKPKPLMYGKCNNVTPVMVNTSKLIYQISGNALSDISAVYDNGVVLTAGATAYADQADMEANAPEAGQYRVWLTGGCFRLGSSPAGTITADAVQGTLASDRTAGQIIKQIVTAKLGSNQIVEQSIIDLDAAAPYVIGYYTGPDNVTVKTAIDTICASVGAWWGFDNSGLFWSKQLTPPDAAQSLMTLTEAEILSLERTATADSDKGVPSYKINLDFSKNWTVQNSGLAGSITQNQLLFDADDGQQLSTDRRNMLGMEYVRTSAGDASVQTKHLLSPEINVQTTIDTLADANTEASRLLSLRKVRRDRLSVKLSMTNAVAYPDVGFWDDEAVTEMPGSSQKMQGIVYNGYAYIIGGGRSISAKVMRLDLNNPTGAWDDAGVTDLPVAIYGHSVSVCSNYVYVMGGIAAWGAMQNKVYRLDLNNPTGAWDDAGVTDLPEKRSNHRSLVHNNSIYVIGGFAGTLAQPTKAVMRLDLSNSTGAWDDAGVTDLPFNFIDGQCLVYGNYIYVAGAGLYGSNTNIATRLDLSNPTGAWDDAGVTDLPVAISGAGHALYNGKFCITQGTSTYCLDLSNTTGDWNDQYLPPITGVSNTFNLLISNNGKLFSFGAGEIGGATATTLLLRINSDPNDFTQLTSLGRTVLVKYPRYGYDVGRPMKIIGVESDHQNRQITLDLWG